MFPEWHHAVPESAYFKVPETPKTFCMYPISRFVYVLHWLATRLLYLTRLSRCLQGTGLPILECCLNFHPLNPFYCLLSFRRSRIVHRRIVLQVLVMLYHFRFLGPTVTRTSLNEPMTCFIMFGTNLVV